MKHIFFITSVILSMSCFGQTGGIPLSNGFNANAFRGLDLRQGKLVSGKQVPYVTLSEAGAAIVYKYPGMFGISVNDGTGTKLYMYRNDTTTLLPELDWNYMSNKPTLFSGAYSALSGAPTFKTINGSPLTGTGDISVGAGTPIVNSGTVQATLVSGSNQLDVVTNGQLDRQGLVDTAQKAIVTNSDLATYINTNIALQKSNNINFANTRKVGTVYGDIIDQYTGEAVTTIASTTFNNVTLSDADIDGAMIWKYAGVYLCRVAAGVNIKWYGANRTTDNTTAIQTAINFNSKFNVPVIIPAGTFLTGALQLKNNTTFIGIDSTSRLLMNPVSSNHTMFPQYTSSNLSNISFTNLTLDGNIRYINHFMDAGSPIKDTSELLLNLTNYSNIIFKNVTFNGAEKAIFLNTTNNVSILDSKFTNIGNTPIATYYDSSNHTIKIERCKFLTYGMRDSYDFATGLQRFGASAVEGGGDNWVIDYNLFFNGSNTHWATSESHFTHDVLWDHNTFDGNGWNAMSLSFGGYGGAKTFRQTITNNVWVNIGSAALRSSDSLNGVPKYIFPNYNELTQQTDFTFDYNTVSNCGNGFGDVLRGSFSHNKILNTVNQVNSSFFRFFGTDAYCRVANNLVYEDSMRSGFLFEGITNLCTVSNNTFVTPNVNRAFVEVTSGAVDTSSSFSNNTLSGTPYAVIYNNSTNMHMTTFLNNDFSGTTLTRQNAFAFGTDNGSIYFGTNRFNDGKVQSDAIKSVGDIMVNNMTIGVGAGSIPYNTVIGASALSSNTTGSNLVAIGGSVLNANTIGTDNTGIGSNSLKFNINGNFNSNIGSNGLVSNTSGNSNSNIGYQGLFSNTSGSNNISMGFQTLYHNTTGNGNVGIGTYTLLASTTASNLVAIGSSALASNTTGLRNNAIGYLGLEFNTTGSDNTTVGDNNLSANTGGSFNTSLGSGNLTHNTTGNGNLSLGYSGLVNNTTGGNNVNIGYQGLYNNTTGQNNIGIGTYTLLANTTSSNLVAIGNSALIANTGGTRNVAVGNNTSVANTVGTDNTVMGDNAANHNTTGNNNTIYGSQAFTSNTTGSGNVTVGQGSGSANTTGSNNVFIGTNATVPSPTANNQISINNVIYGSPNGSVSVGVSIADPSAIFHTQSTTQGFLYPRMTTTQRDAIASPAEGLHIYNLTTHADNFYNGTAWKEIATTP